MFSGSGEIVIYNCMNEESFYMHTTEKAMLYELPLWRETRQEGCHREAHKVLGWSPLLKEQLVCMCYRKVVFCTVYIHSSGTV